MVLYTATTVLGAFNTFQSVPRNFETSTFVQTKQSTKQSGFNCVFQQFHTNCKQMNNDVLRKTGICQEKGAANENR